MVNVLFNMIVNELVGCCSANTGTRRRSHCLDALQVLFKIRISFHYLSIQVNTTLLILGFCLVQYKPVPVYGHNIQGFVMSGFRSLVVTPRNDMRLNRMLVSSFFSLPGNLIFFNFL